MDNMNARLVDSDIPRLELLPISSEKDVRLSHSKEPVSLVYYAEPAGRFDVAINEAPGMPRDLLIYYVLHTFRDHFPLLFS